MSSPRRVTADRQICMAVGMCVLTADAFFEQGDNARIEVSADQ